jgi:hypothetical protein
MALPAFKERRLSERSQLSGLLPGRLTIENLKPNIICRAVDVSTHGLGIVIQAIIKEDMTAKLECNVKGKIQVVDMKVAWAKPDFGKQDLYRGGLVTLDPNVDLESIFLITGCIKASR